jgi:hypothetical protein
MTTWSSASCVTINPVLHMPVAITSLLETDLDLSEL